VIRQGDVCWVELPRAAGSIPGGRRPAVVLQHDRFNQTRIATAVVVAITSRLKYAALPGNVRLKQGEGGLTQTSVVNVTQIATVDRGRSGPASGRCREHAWRKCGPVSASCASPIPGESPGTVTWRTIPARNGLGQGENQLETDLASLPP